LWSGNGYCPHAIDDPRLVDHPSTLDDAYHIRYIWVGEGDGLPKKLKKAPAFFFRTEAGGEPVREWLKDLPDEDRRVVGEEIATVEFGWPIGMPLCRSIGDGLWEVRSSLPSRREARVIFCIVEEKMVLLHGFIKKSRKTPKAERDLALKRLKEIG
jgi:phage-related protein